MVSPVLEHSEVVPSPPINNLRHMALALKLVPDSRFSLTSFIDANGCKWAPLANAPGNVYCSGLYVPTNLALFR